MWLTDLTVWLQAKYDQVLGYFDTSLGEVFEFWNDLYEQFTEWCFDYAHDVLLAAIRSVMDLAVAMLNELPVPEFLANYSLGDLLGQTPQMVQYLGTQLRIAECFGLIAAGFVFRLTRKVLTLGRW